jgi:serine phosphatase RsbU (regulator of sigma subunit)
MARPISIRVSLLRNVLALLIVLSAAIMGMTAIAARTAAARLSRSLIGQTLEQTYGRLEEFFDPVWRGVELGHAWARQGRLDIHEPRELSDLFVPLLEQNAQVTSLLIADESGHEYMLLRADDVWSVRQTRPDEWGDQTRWLRWSLADPQVTEFERTLAYDPRERPWFRGAIARAEAIDQAGTPTSATMSRDAVHWTPPYTFFTTREPGITASVAFDFPDGRRGVFALDVLLRDISRFTSSLQVSGRGSVIVMDAEGAVIGLPRDPRFDTDAKRRDALLKQPQDLGLPVITDAVAAFDAATPADESIVRFHSGGEWWWGDARRLPIGAQRTFVIAVVVPETDLLPGLTQLRVLIIGVVVSALVVALIQAVLLARRFSRPIESVVYQIDRISRLDLEPAPPAISRISEVRRLMDAQDRMRDSLRSLLKLERDLQVARQIQQGTFPQTLPRLAGFDIEARSEPADETGGDTYDVVGFRSVDVGRSVILDDIRPDRAMLLLADATGHGVGPALSVAQVRAMVRMAVRMNRSLATIVRHVNDQLCVDLPAGRFITAWFGEIDVRKGTITSFSAGQGPLLFVHGGRDAIDVLPVDAPPLGVVDALDVSPRDPIVMRPGDVFVILSDGFYEAADPQGDRFGIDRMTDLLRAHRRRSAKQILDAVRVAVEEFAQGTPADDDRTAIVIRRTR